MKSEEMFPREAELLRQGLQEWADEGSLPSERSQALESLVRQHMGAPAKEPKRSRVPARRRWLWSAAAAVAVAVITVPVAVPSARAWVVETFPALASFLGEQMEVEQGWAWAEEHGQFQEILASAEDQGYTFRVHRVLADPTQTTIIYSVEGPDAEAMGAQAPDFLADGGGIRFNGESFLSPSSGASRIIERVALSSSSGTHRVIDGVLVGSLEIAALPEESGTLEIDLRQIGDVKGDWPVSFAVTRAPLTALTRTIQVDQVLHVDGGDFRVTQLEVAPTQTAVHLRYEGTAPAPDLISGAVRLITPAGPIEPRGVTASTDFSQTGVTAADYVLDFQPVPEGTEEISLQVDDMVMPLTGQKLSLPFQVGAAAAVGDLPEVTVLEADDTKAVVSWSCASDADYEFWWVIDDRGEAYPAVASGRTDGAGNMQLDISWDPLPAERRPVALEARQVTQRVEGPWEVQIPLN